MVVGPLLCGACLFYESYECNQRCCWPGSSDSLGWDHASRQDVQEIGFHCCRVLGAYGQTLDELASLVKPHDSTFRKEMVFIFDHPPIKEEGACPPYYIYVDDERKEVAVYIRGLHLGHRQDYRTLMSNRREEQVYSSGVIHYGMYRAAQWSMFRMAPYIRKALDTHPGYRVTIVGHSLGAGVASLFTVLLALDLGALGGIDRSQLRCYALAPPRVMSAALAVEFNDVIYSVIYQDDFLPRMTTSAAEEVLGAAVACTGVFLCYYFMSQLCGSRSKEVQPSSNSTDLCAPGRIFHVVYKKPGSCKQQPLIVRTAPSVSGNFEKLVVSLSATSRDHSVLMLAEHLKLYDPDLVAVEPPQQQEME